MKHPKDIRKQFKCFSFYIVCSALLMINFFADNVMDAAFNTAVAVYIGCSILVLFILTINRKINDKIHSAFFAAFNTFILIFVIAALRDYKYMHLAILFQAVILAIYGLKVIYNVYIILCFTAYVISFWIYRGHELASTKEQISFVIVAAAVMWSQWIIKRMVGKACKNERILGENSKSFRDIMKMLSLKRMEVEKATRAKSMFISNISHEIRTPVNAILGINEIILRESSDKKTIEYSNKIQNAGTTLLSLINDILDFSKIEAGKMQISCSEYNMKDLLSELYNITFVKADEKGLRYELDIAPDLPSKLYGDVLRIKQIILNVMSNAVKYTERGFVRLSMDWQPIGNDNIRILISVADSGKGIKAENIPRLFSSFDRIDENGVHHIEGTGLGMAITKNLLKLMDGTISVESTYGEGSTFTVSMAQKVVSREGIGRFSPDFGGIKEKYEESLIAPNAKVLVVDDNSLNILVVEGLLTKTQIQIDTATSGAECLELVAKNKYDIIFMDHMMPEMDGVQTFQRMLKMDNNMSADAVVIALTANAGENARDSYIAYGFDDYLSKPVSGRSLEEALIKYLPKNLFTIKTVEAKKDKREKTPDNTVINYEDALLYAGGDKALLKETTASFAEISPLLRNKLSDLIEADDIKNYAMEVHALKSNAKLIGANDLVECAYRHECAAKSEDTGFIKDNWDKLIKEWDRVLDNIECDIGDIREAVSTQESIRLSEFELNIYIDEIKRNLENQHYEVAESLLDDILQYNIDSGLRQEFLSVKEKIRTGKYREIDI